MKKKKVIIIGAGPAGLTAGYFLLKDSDKFDVTIVEAAKQVGGISKTISYNGNRMDLGGHRFFTKNQEILDLWKKIIPIQGLGSYDDKKIGSCGKTFELDGPDPDESDNVLLVRNRVSRIYYLKKFFDYPITLKLKTFTNLGFFKTFSSGISYLKSLIFKKTENNLENFYINRFGKKLYNIFFEGYTEKLWGRSPKDIDSSWGSQRVKGISILEVMKNSFGKIFGSKFKSNETSLIESFYYPKFGPGQMWERMAEEFIRLGGKILTDYEVTSVNNNKNNIKSLVCVTEGKTVVLSGDIFISSMPIKDLIVGMNKVPKGIHKIALGLPYRDFITVGLVVKKLKIKNKTSRKTIGNIIPDCWIYVQSKDVRLGRIQIFNNWSPYMVADIENTISLGLEYFCNEGDEMWLEDEITFKNKAIKELIAMDILEAEADVLDFHVEKVKKAYPAYFDTYSQFDEIKSFLDKFENLYCIGRNGQHRYNNMDHSMETAMVCVNNIINGVRDRDNIWNVNSDSNYHEKK